VLSNPVGQRRILTEHFAHAVDVAGVTRSRQIDERAARLQVGHDLCGSHRPVARNIAPAAVEVVAMWSREWAERRPSSER
jgi:hypothetical protein